MWTESTRLVLSASECVRRSHRQCLRRPTHSDAERTCRAVGPTQFTPPNKTRQDGPVCVVSGVPVWIWQLRWTCSDSSCLSATVLSCRESTIYTAEVDTTQTRQCCRVWSEMQSSSVRPLWTLLKTCSQHMNRNGLNWTRLRGERPHWNTSVEN